MLVFVIVETELFGRMYENIDTMVAIWVGVEGSGCQHW
jgi:hypothetical protein